jgi:hypothetical protein
MSAPFTPGPWTVVEGDNGYSPDALHIEEDSSEVSFVVAVVLADTVALAEKAEATANLIAAAPDLYEQVKLFVRCIEYNIRVAETKGDDEGARLQSFTLAMANDVLAKAEGRS